MKNLLLLLFILMNVSAAYAQPVKNLTPYKPPQTFVGTKQDCNQPISWSNDVSDHMIFDRSCENCFYFAYKDVYVGFVNDTYKAGDTVLFTNRCQKFYLTFKDKTYMFIDDKLVYVNYEDDHFLID